MRDIIEMAANVKDRLESIFGPAPYPWESDEPVISGVAAPFLEPLSEEEFLKTPSEYRPDFTPEQAEAYSKFEAQIITFTTELTKRQNVYEWDDRYFPARLPLLKENTDVVERTRGWLRHYNKAKWFLEADGIFLEGYFDLDILLYGDVSNATHLKGALDKAGMFIRWQTEPPNIVSRPADIR